jgi:hypothetical protein
LAALAAAFAVLAAPAARRPTARPIRPTAAMPSPTPLPNGTRCRIAPAFERRPTI